MLRTIYYTVYTERNSSNRIFIYLYFVTQTAATPYTD